MNLFGGLEEAQKALLGHKIALTIGNFDGVHLGHQALLKDLKLAAKSYSLESVVLTFDPHPRAVLQPRHPFGQRLFPITDLNEQMKKHKVESLWVEPFNLALSELSPEGFIEKYLEPFDLEYLLVGHDFHFGKNREGKIEHLLDWCRKKSVQIKVFNPYLKNDQRVSTSLIREFLLQGKASEISDFLGRPYAVKAKIEHGHKTGRGIGFPTANMNISAPIQNGVYITLTEHRGKKLPSITNVGLRPTVNKDWDLLSRNIETYILDKNLNLYEKEIGVHFLEFMREEKKFETLDDLKVQIEKDVDMAHRYFGLDTA